MASQVCNEVRQLNCQLRFREGSVTDINVVNVVSPTRRSHRPMHQVEIKVFQSQIAQRLIKPLLDLIRLMAATVQYGSASLCNERANIRKREGY